MFSSISSGALVLAVLQYVARTSAADVNYALSIVNEVVAPDGFPRSVVTANGSIPGPLISANIDDRLLVNVTNYLEDPTMLRSTSIHWHGIFHRKDHAVSMDGAVSVTQCPIVPGHSFMYNFTVPQQRGTYWYHSHLSTQYCDGLIGPLVIYDPEDPHKDLYDVDDESTVIMLQEWYHTAAPSLKTETTPTPDSTLINGHGRWNVSPTSDLAVIRAQDGKRHRFRLINSGCNPSFNFTIDAHNLTVIEADGIEVEPVTVDQLQIFAGQRYSVVVTMDKPIDNYWIRAIPSTQDNSTIAAGINSAVLRYDGAPIAEPRECAEDDGAKKPVILQETDLHPLADLEVPGEPYPGGADVVLDLTPSIANGSWMINNVSFHAPSIPVLLQVLSGVTDAKDMLPAGSVYALPKNATVEINVKQVSDHPFHLHGHNFDVVRTSGNSEYNFNNPIRRDVVTPGQANDTITFRFRTDNPGPWIFHCHIDWHFDHGLAVVFAEDIDEIANKDIVSPEWSDLCPLYDQLNPDKHFDLVA
ncbi:laccase [Sanghuangporus baumii]|uniref:Laccase n=1 Tax=Sanghuangporus baumii TaxID=108892 RepID=A0A9Q5HT75_SANBA|nr:laccase [Sanghuangporus baumii]